MITKIYIDDIRTGGKVPTDCELSVVGGFLRIPFPEVIIEIKTEDIKELLRNTDGRQSKQEQGV